MTSVKNKIGEAMVNAGTSLTSQGEKLAGQSTKASINQSILRINLVAPEGTGIRYRSSSQQIRFR